MTNEETVRKVLITGGYGFIGSNLVRRWLDEYPYDSIGILDCKTYAARPEWVREHSEYRGRVMIANVDLRDYAKVLAALIQFNPDDVIHLAAESHVCRSIEGPRTFVETNVMGTFNLLEACRHLWNSDLENHRFHHVSTDEVYGEAEDKIKFHEQLKYDPRSPYAASKAASDHLVMAHVNTYGLNAVITNCSNNFGPNQHEEKLIPKVINSLLRNQEMTVYGSGKQVRDWLFVDEHCDAIDAVFHDSGPGETWCVGGNLELTNLDVIEAVHWEMCQMGLAKSDSLKLRHTDDRPTDDQRYSIDTSKIKTLQWAPSPEEFHSNLRKTIKWYWERMHRS